MKWSLVGAAMLAAFAANPLLATAQAQEQKKLTCAEQLKLVKAEWEKAPAGPKKDAAHTHYVRAEMAYDGLGREKWKRAQERKCLESLEKAKAALKE